MACPAGYKFLRNCSWRTLLRRDSTAANEVYTFPGNPERVGFGAWSRGQSIWAGPIVDGFSPIAALMSGLSAAGIRNLTVDEYGPLIVYPWQFQLIDNGGEYLIGEWVTNAEFK